MLNNLKDQLLKKGLIKEEDILRAENSEKGLKKLKSLKSKNEQYALIRTWVENNRLDKQIASLDDEKFFFETMEKEISWLSLPKALIEDIKIGKAAVIAYMGHHGLVHALVPRDIALDVKEVFPLWIRVLN